MDKFKAIRGFQWQVGQLRQLLLVTDSEVRGLFGEEVAAALAELERFNGEKKVCLVCGGRCCHDIGCELHATQFSQCPIHGFRPIACRLHFCHRFDAASRSLVEELRDIFFGAFMAVSHVDSSKSASLDCPPLARPSPELVATLSPWMRALRAGSLAPERARELIRRQAEQYRSVSASEKF